MGKADSDSVLIDQVAEAVGSVGNDGDWALSTVATEYVNAAATVLGNDTGTRRLLREALRGRALHAPVELQGRLQPSWNGSAHNATTRR